MPDFNNHYRYIERIAVRVAILEAGLKSQAQLNTQHQAELAAQIQSHFNTEELDELCFRLGISPEEIAGDTITTRPFHLVTHAARHGLTNQLLNLLRQERPFLDW